MTGLPTPALDDLKVSVQPRATGAVAAPLLKKSFERRTLLDFIPSSLWDSIEDGSVPSNVDLTANLAAAQAYSAQPRSRLIIPSGLYPYSVSPNWAADNASIQFEGEVRFRYTGTGRAVIIDAGANSVDGNGQVVYAAGKVNMRFGSPENPLMIEAGPTAQDAVYTRAIHHSRMAFNVRGCGAAYAALRNDFGVCTDFHLVVSNNEGAWYQGAKPGYGFIFGARQLGADVNAEPTSYCDLIRPIIEGVGIGGEARNALGCRTLGGTIEGCTTYALDIQVNSTGMQVEGTDFEANAGFDIRDNGINTGLIGIQSLGLTIDNQPNQGVIVGATSNSLQIERGRVNKIQSVIGAKNAVLDRVRHSYVTGGGISDPANAFRLLSCMDYTKNNVRDGLPSRTVLAGLPADTGSGPYNYFNTSSADQKLLVYGGANVTMYFYNTSGAVDQINNAGFIVIQPGEGVGFGYTTAPKLIVVT